MSKKQGSKANESFRGKNQDSKKKDALSDDSDSSNENLHMATQGYMNSQASVNCNKKLRHQYSLGWIIMEGYKTLPDSKPEEVKLPNKLEGYLRKRRKWPMKGWHKRFFVLERGLLYYAKSSSHIVKGRYRGQVDLGISVVSYKAKHRRIDIDADILVHHIQIKDVKTFNDWIQSLTQHRLYRQWELTVGGGTLFTNIGENTTPLTDVSYRTARTGENEDIRNFTIQKASTIKLDRAQTDLKVLQTKLFDLNNILEKIKFEDSDNSSPIELTVPVLNPECSSPISPKRGRKFGHWYSHNRKHSHSQVTDLQVGSGDSSSSTNKPSSNLLTRPVSLHQSTSNPNIHLDPSNLLKHPGRMSDELSNVSSATKTALSKSFVEPANEILDQMRCITSILQSESERVRHEVEKAAQSGQNNKTSLAEALQQNAELRAKLARIRAETDFSAQSGTLTIQQRNDFKLISQSMSRESITVFHDAAEYLDSDASSSDNSEDYNSEDSEWDEPSVDDDSNNKDYSVPVITAKTGRRERLPAQQPDTSSFSLMNLLCKNIGRDLSKVRLPVILNEPLGVLQKLCEELEYSELLDAASCNKSPLERMVYVAAFAVSGYAATYFRGKTKPFNPLMGETYEYIREDKGWKFVSEQVSHHPPQAACHCQSNNWTFWQDLQLKNKFWGKSIEAIPVGTVNLSMPGCHDHYTWHKVTTCVHNIFGSDRYVDHYGDMMIVGKEANCKLTFHKANSWTNRRYEVSGTVETKKGEKVQVFGKWNEGFYYGQQNTARCVWRSAAMPQDYELYYGFTRFAMELNELDHSLKDVLPCTDTRLRPDQRQLENGLVDDAENEKHRVEESQRNRSKSDEFLPHWFKINEANGNYEYNNLYWKVRSEPNGFKKLNLPQLW